MAEKGQATAKQKWGCASGIVLLLAATGVAVWLGAREEANKDPCVRYAETVVRALDNCHSGVNRNVGRHTATCKERVNPSEACLQAVKALECKALEADPTAPAACRN